MKHLQYESQTNKQIERDNSKRIFMNQFDIFDRNQGYLQSYKTKGQDKMVKLRNRNVIMIKQYQTGHNQVNDCENETNKLTEIIQAELNIRKQPKLNKFKSKVITIIDNDDIEQDHIQEKAQKDEQNQLDLMRLPMILNRNSQLNKSQKSKQKQFLSYIYSQINSHRNFQNNKKQRSPNIRSQKSISHHNEEYIMDVFDRDRRQQKNQHQGLLFPTVNKNRTISMSEPKSQSKKKKNQIKLSGISVIPTQRINPNKQISSLNQTKTNRSRKINLISSQMIHNNSVLDVKKSVYQLLVRKAQSSY